MMKESVNYWLATIPLSVAALAWALNQFSAVLTSWLADRRILKETLYFLLELRHSFKVVLALRDPAKYTQMYADALQRRLPGIVLDSTDQAQLTDAIGQVLRGIEVRMIAESGLQEGYAAALLKLSSVDPINAYRLRGKDSLLSFVGELNEHTQEVIGQQAHLRANPERQQRMLQTAKLVQPHTDTLLIKAGLEEIEQVLIEIAQKIGWRIRRELRELLTEADPSTEAHIQQAMEEGVNKLVEVIEQQFYEENSDK
jgi:hypothetical protein